MLFGRPVLSISILEVSIAFCSKSFMYLVKKFRWVCSVPMAVRKLFMRWLVRFAFGYRMRA